MPAASRRGAGRAVVSAALGARGRAIARHLRGPSRPRAPLSGRHLRPTRPGDVLVAATSRSRAGTCY